MIIIIIVSGFHHYKCVAPLVANSLQSGLFWARSTALVHDSPWESRSFCTVFIQVIRGRPGGLFQYTEGEEVEICLVSTLSSIWAICPNRVRRRAWIISVSRGWLVWRQTSSLEMKWYHLMPRSIQRHHWLTALILRAFSLVIANYNACVKSGVDASVYCCIVRPQNDVATTKS